MARLKIDVRLGRALSDELAAFQAENQISTLSAAARALIQLGLQKSTALDTAWRRIAWREGFLSGEGAFKAAYTRALEEAEKGSR